MKSQVIKFLPLYWLVIVGALLAPACVHAAEDKLIHATNGSGVFGYKHTPVLPWCGFHVHDPDRPAPVRVMNLSPQPITPPPADALVLFDGKDTTVWRSNSWKRVDNVWETAGSIAPRTTEKFGSFQLHVEWQMPANFKGPWHDQGNSGVLIHGLYEIQIFDSFNQKWAPDGQCAAIYGQTPPLVNATLPPGQWQSYDMTFTAPTIVEGKVTKPARLTLHHNGVLVHKDQEIYGGTGHKVLPRPVTVSEGPIGFAGHGCPVRFRNIWIRKL